jgi:hypothetical protein
LNGKAIGLLNTPFKTIAWNGIAISVPDSWEVGRMGMHHLEFERNGQGVMEIKWQKVKGRFSTKSHFKKLKGTFKGPLKGAIHPWSPPPSWNDILAQYQMDGFRWQSDQMNGRGIILWCAHCRTATLIQFIEPSPESTVHVQHAILSSYRDHREDGQTRWALFDIHALLPEDFIMRSYTFRPGRFLLSFENGSARLTLHRWAPAAALLTDRTLSDFAATTFGTSPSRVYPLDAATYPAVAWEKRPHQPWFFHRWRAKPHFHQGRIWHVTSKNRILGARLEDKKPLPDPMLDELCTHYETT